MGKLEGKVPVITAATSGMALATAKLFVEEGAYVFITGRRKEKLDETGPSLRSSAVHSRTNRALASFVNNTVGQA
jgi:NADP-dependent 3-hydroxy acid dehydrogenase YdfG